jgi:hypothetical protein
MCALCEGDQALRGYVEALREEGAGYKRIWRALQECGYSFSRDVVQAHVLQHLDRGIMSAIGDAADRGDEMPMPEEYFAAHGVANLPVGLKLKAATMEERGPDGEKHWIRVVPEVEENDRIEIRQAQPVNLVVPPFSTFDYLPQTSWRTWIATPDAQIGYWMDHKGIFHTIHDERCFDLVFQVASALAQDGGIHGWLDVGDFADLSAPSRHNPTKIDTHVNCLNMAFERGAEEFARRRSIIGPNGELVILSGNHDIRLQTRANQEQPYLVGMRRAGDPDDEHPVLTVPFLMRARDYDVEWVPSYPTAYRRLNSNLLAFHSPAYGSKALDTARKIAARVHASVIFGHTHRRESLAENIETTKGNRTMEVWSDGTFARTDGSLPSQRNTFDEYGDRLLVGNLPNKQWGMLSEAMHQGFSIIHVETEDRERFSVERVAIWDGFCQVRGQTFEASVDMEGAAA